MSDLISREVVRRLINSERSKEQMLHILGTIPTVDTEPQWIPTSERLPEVRQWVLCQCRAGMMDILRRTIDGGWEQPYPKVTYMRGFVLAWMPLPKPYEGE